MIARTLAQIAEIIAQTSSEAEAADVAFEQAERAVTHARSRLEAAYRIADDEAPAAWLDAHRDDGGDRPPGGPRGRAGGPMLMPRAKSPHGAVVLAFLHAPEWWPLLTAPPDDFDAAELTREVASSLTPREQGRLAGRVLMRWPRTDPATLRRVLPGMEPK